VDEAKIPQEDDRYCSIYLKKHKAQEAYEICEPVAVREQALFSTLS
jgi:hypothetical protein